MKLYLYTNTKPNNTLVLPYHGGTKAQYLGIDKECDIIQGTTLTRPEFLISGGFDSKKMNYVYCDKFQRFYHVTDIVAMSNDMYKLVCECDVLESFKDSICSANYLIERQENKYNNLLEDPILTAMVGSYLEVPTKVGTVGTDINYVLTVAGGAE